MSVTTQGAEAMPVQINYASRAELMTIPGIGEKSADAILKNRDTNGNIGVGGGGGVEIYIEGQGHPGYV